MRRLHPILRRVSKSLLSRLSLSRPNVNAIKHKPITRLPNSELRRLSDVCVIAVLLTALQSQGLGALQIMRMKTWNLKSNAYELNCLRNQMNVSKLPKLLRPPNVSSIVLQMNVMLCKLHLTRLKLSWISNSKPLRAFAKMLNKLRIVQTPLSENCKSHAMTLTQSLQRHPLESPHPHHLSQLQATQSTPRSSPYGRKSQHYRINFRTRNQRHSIRKNVFMLQSDEQLVLRMSEMFFKRLLPKSRLSSSRSLQLLLVCVKRLKSCRTR
mmetsp:Transcript_1223/g.2962  ORF Transcript_1223/g.2962 Transcript_1223/m.2962 type:complete len:268 (+) Transcript_1223:1152-1955(+)